MAMTDAASSAEIPNYCGGWNATQEKAGTSPFSQSAESYGLSFAFICVRDGKLCHPILALMWQGGL
ncbi:MAG: hypothetical protein CM15mP95_3200 [Alphaproteobacteria bacterium]|nr:MAG: hypothetical protein CM15mP95_3200 [Alphaproteobacteria bacterium]